MMTTDVWSVTGNLILKFSRYRANQVQNSFDLFVKLQSMIGFTLWYRQCPGVSIMPFWNSSSSDLNTKIFWHQNLAPKKMLKHQYFLESRNTFLSFMKFNPGFLGYHSVLVNVSQVWCWCCFFNKTILKLLEYIFWLFPFNSIELCSFLTKLIPAKIEKFKYNNFCAQNALQNISKIWE